jgi:NAD+ kinase
LLYSRHIKKEHVAFIEVVIEELAARNITILVNDLLYTYLASKKKLLHIAGQVAYVDLATANIDCVITLGGDGTILGAITLIREHSIPILGINLGRLGFLAGVEKSLINEAIEKLANGDYHIEPRSMLHLDAEPPLFAGINFALNDFTLHKRDTSSMVTIHTYINDEYLTSYWADGIIVATPTGSTGYSLSCGGPIVFPEANNFIITPVAPHNLNVRPLVVADDAVLSFEIEGRSRHFLCTLDSRHETITNKHRLAIKKANFNTLLIVLDGLSYLKTIREKLSWGTDQRN